MRISYVTIDNINIHNWSGLDFFIAQALQNQGATLDFVSDIRVKKLGRFYLNKIFYKLQHRTYMWDRDPIVASKFASVVSKHLMPSTDVVFSPTPIPIAYLDTNKPKVFYHDATFSGLINFYEQFSNLSRKTIKDGNNLEQAALESCKFAIYSSDWAAKTAIENYNVDPAKIRVIPFGANIDSKRTLDDIKAILQLRSKQVCNLLFLGVNWERKGGDIALKVAKELDKRGVPVILHLAGLSSPPNTPLPDFVKNHGFISKTSDEGRKKIDHLLASSHFLILPSKADCTPVVYSEANSFGLPCITSNVGGIPTIIKDDVNGKMFSPTADINEYCDYIQATFLNQTLYTELALTSFAEFETRLNWDSTGKALMKVLNNCL